MLLAALGHFAWWLRVSNAAHATAWPKVAVRPVSAAAKAVALFGSLALLAAAAWYSPQGLWGLLVGSAQEVPRTAPAWAAVGYGGFCLLWAVKVVAGWAWDRWHRPPAELFRQRTLAEHRPPVDWATDDGCTVLPPGSLGLRIERWLLRLPGNESLHLEVNEKHLLVPGLPAALQGLRIVHFSDLHLAGAVPREFFEQAVRQVLELEPDLVAITGDLVDRRGCLDWLRKVLAPLQAVPGGVLVILGNHDRELGARHVIQRLEQLPGITYLGARCEQIQVRNQSVLVAGSQWPWLGPRPRAEETARAEGAPAPQFRLLLAHSPDEFAWAARCGFHLVLAGHVHGGQIRLPVLGPVVAPSRYGVKYATAGVYRRGNTVMHVSRGLSGKCPLRWRCPPELTCLVLHDGNQQRRFEVEP